MEERKAYAYDPIENEDVPIRCSHKHQNTEYDRIDGETLPVLIESDFKHDPVEACQGSYTEIAEIPEGCPNCGYDRMNVSVHTLAGVHREACRACGVDITDRGRDDWTPTKPTDPVESVRKHSDYIGTVGHRGMKLYERNERGLYALVQYGRQFGISDDEVIDLAQTVLKQMDEGDLDRPTARRLMFALGNAYPPKEDDDE